MSSYEKISRRNWLKCAAIFATGAAASPLASSSGMAASKVAKATVHYQDHPRAMKMCGMCKYFISAADRRNMMGGGMMDNGTCQLVAGQISPMGYCDLYAPRS